MKPSGRSAGEHQLPLSCTTQTKVLPAVILTPEGNQILIIGGEVHSLHLGLVELQLGIDCSLSIVPDNYNSLGTYIFIY